MFLLQRHDFDRIRDDKKQLAELLRKYRLFSNVNGIKSYETIDDNLITSEIQTDHDIIFEINEKHHDDKENDENIQESKGLLQLPKLM